MKYLIDINEEHNFKIYIDNIKDIIQKEIPSSSSWIEALKYEVDNDTLFFLSLQTLWLIFNGKKWLNG